MEIAKVVKLVHKKGATQYFWQYSVYTRIVLVRMVGNTLEYGFLLTA